MKMMKMKMTKMMKIMKMFSCEVASFVVSTKNRSSSGGYSKVGPSNYHFQGNDVCFSFCS